MALSAKLEMRQGQQLVMTPQLQQAIRLLQLSNMELNAFVEAELERNPLLERDEEADSSPQSVPASEARDTDTRGADAPDAGADTSDLDFNGSEVDYTGSFDTEIDNVYPEASPTDYGTDPQSSWSSMPRSGGSFDGDSPDYESYVGNELSLKDHLTEQLNLGVKTPAERMIGAHLIDLVDDAGYLTGSLEEIALKLGTETAAVEAVLTKLQSFEPTGVFARNLAECLALQLKEQNRYDPVIAAVLENLDLLAAHNLATLRKKAGVDQDELHDIIHELKSLDPKPGLKYGATPVQPVVPDVLVRPAGDGGWIVELNSDSLPRVLVNRMYVTRVSKCTRSDGDKDYIQDCLQTANWLVKSLDQRARTILRVAEEIVRQQDRFFIHGVEHLRPLNLRTVADAISMHESTISRVTSNKYMATPRGILELKYFFTSAIQSADNGDAYSSEAVRHRIKTLIDAETAKTVLSDDKIVEKLKAEGIDIARRTIAKYREAMRIPSSVQRRRAKRLSESAA
jgi:RNA polymerase sigma-54 factor